MKTPIETAKRFPKRLLKSGRRSDRVKHGIAVIPAIDDVVQAADLLQS
jgi:hypothetical protein